MAKILDMDGKPAKAKTAKAKQADADPTQSYAKNPEFLGQAFSLYCKGMSLPSVADALLVEWPNVSTRTLQRVAKEHSWEKVRAAYLKMHADATASAEGLVPEIILQLQRIRAQMEARGLIEAKDVYAYRQLVEDLMWYTGKHPKLKDNTPLAIGGEEEIAALLEAIAEDDVVGPAWKRRRPHIEKKYREKLEAGAAKHNIKVKRSKQG